MLLHSDTVPHVKVLISDNAQGREASNLDGLSNFPMMLIILHLALGSRTLATRFLCILQPCQSTPMAQSRVP